jgi:glycosyltransferase involved in cell wall biosynthesis
MADSGRTPQQTTAVTVVSRDRLPAAKVLARTYLEHHPGHGFLTMVVDHKTGDLPVVGHDWLAVPEDEYLRLATRYPRRRLLDAVIPLVLRQVLDHAEVAVYLDPETQVLGPFTGATALAAECDIVLAPWSLAPLPLDGYEPAGHQAAFDPGFLAIGRGGKAFLDFCAEREQLRLDLVPGLFRHEVIRAPGLAAGYWNLHEREPDSVRFIHFPGYDPEKPWLLSTHCAGRPRVRIAEDARLRRLADTYRDLLLAEGKAEPYGLGVQPDGSPITDRMRELFREAKDNPPHAFGDGFQRWLAEPDSPVAEAAGLGRLAMRVWLDRPDLQAAFRDPTGADAGGYLQWCRAHGAQEEGIPAAGQAVRRLPRPPVDEFGVNVAGYLTAEFGLGEQSRLVLNAVQQAGIPVAAVVEEQALSVRTGIAAPQAVGETRFPVTIMSVNADFTKLLLDSYPELGHERYRIGLWAWELEEFPAHLHKAFELVDEVWTVSEFTRRAIEPHSPVPVRAFPMPVPDPGAMIRKRGDITRFLFAFDFNSTGQRKNPWGLVTAFQRAFPGRDDVRLVIKAISGGTNVAAAQRLKYAIGDDHRVKLIERFLSVRELGELYTDSDAYVSLHRSEGFGLTVAEAMIRGMPVICTGYSGTAEFLDSSVGWPIPYSMTEVGPGWPPYQAEAQWAEPDLDEAAKAMREVADNRAEAARRGAAAREHLLNTRSTAISAQWVRTQLEAAYGTWHARTHAPAQNQHRPLLQRVRRAINLKPQS